MAQLLSALADNPQVFAKTVFILNYDENDGFFDHVPPPVPATRPELGVSLVSTAGETYGDEPVGLGPRVPMIVVSPWTKGGFVNSQVFDHTSVLRFLETRFGVMEPNISTWRRAVCGDLTSIFDFSGQDARLEALPKTDGLVTRAAANRLLAQPAVGRGDAVLPRQERGRRLARPLPYATGRHRPGEGRRTGTDAGQFRRGGRGVRICATKDVRRALELHARGRPKRCDSQRCRSPAGPTAFALRGPNGFLRTFRGQADGHPQVVVEQRDPARRWQARLSLVIQSRKERRVTVTAKGGRYDHGPARTYRLETPRVGQGLLDLGRHGPLV